MAYEGQIAGVGDLPPGRRMRGAAIRFMQRRSVAELAQRRAAIVAAVGEIVELEIVNGGGTGSLELTAAEEAVTEVSAGSGFYAPALFDHYSRFTLTPAAGFALPVVRKPSARVATALGGGYLASGGGDAAGLPTPWLPPGLRLDSEEGAGEVQTPLLGSAAAQLQHRRPGLPPTRQGGRAVRALRLPPPGRGRRDRRRGPHLQGRRRDFPLGAEDPLRVLVCEGAAGVELVAGGLELGPGRVAGGEGLGRLEVALAPVGAAAVGVHDLLDRLEVGAPLHARGTGARRCRRCRARARG